MPEVASGAVLGSNASGRVCNATHADVSGASSLGLLISQVAMERVAESHVASDAVCVGRPSMAPGLESRQTASPITSLSGVRTCQVTRGRGAYGMRRTEVSTFRITAVVASPMGLENGEVAADHDVDMAMVVGMGVVISGTDVEGRGVRYVALGVVGVTPVEDLIAVAGQETTMAMAKLSRQVGDKMRREHVAINGAS